MKRKQYLPWLTMVIGIIGTAYGVQSLVLHFKDGKGLFVPGLILLILGGICLSFTLALVISIYLFNKKKEREVPLKAEEEHRVVVEVEIKEEKPTQAKEVKRAPVQKEYTPSRNNSYSIYDSDSSTVYVKKVGYGPVLRVTGNRILDMRNNTYYRIENNNVSQEGYGLRYEIRNNQIRDAFGGYLYEISGNNINKVFGGFYASISGNYITLFDLSDKYEMDGALSKKQILVVTVLLFGQY